VGNPAGFGRGTFEFPEDGGSLSGQLHKYDDLFEEKIATDFTDFTEWDGEISFLPSGQGTTLRVAPSGRQKQYPGAAL